MCIFDTKDLLLAARSVLAAGRLKHAYLYDLIAAGCFVLGIAISRAACAQRKQHNYGQKHCNNFLHFSFLLIILRQLLSVSSGHLFSNDDIVIMHCTALNCNREKFQMNKNVI